VNPFLRLFRWIASFWQSPDSEKPQILSKDLYPNQVKTARIVRILGSDIPGVVAIVKLIPPFPETDHLLIHLVDVGQLRQEAGNRARRSSDDLPGKGKLPFGQEYLQWCRIHEVDPTHVTHAVEVFWLTPFYRNNRRVIRSVGTYPGNLQHQSKIGNASAIDVIQRLALKIASLPDYPEEHRPWRFYVGKTDWVGDISSIAYYVCGSSHVFQRLRRQDYLNDQN